MSSRHPVAAGPAVKRSAIDGGAMLYEASWSGSLQPRWFEPQFWRDTGAVAGAAPGRGQTLFVSHGGQQLALRHYRRGGLLARWLGDRYAFAGSEQTRPFREWSLTYWLHAWGLPVPAPVAARYLRSGAWYRGDLLTKRIDDALPLSRRLDQGTLSLPVWVAIGRCLRRFHDLGVCHADLNAHNILLRGEQEVFLIDFDRGMIKRRRGLWCDVNLARLHRSLHKVTDPLPPGRFTPTDWHSLLAGYRSAPET